MKIDPPGQQHIFSKSTAQASAGGQLRGNNSPASADIQVNELQQRIGETIRAKILNIELKRMESANAKEDESLVVSQRPLQAQPQNTKAADLYRTHLLNKAILQSKPATTSVANQNINSGQQLLTQKSTDTAGPRLWAITLQLAGLTKPVTTEFSAPQLPAQWAQGHSLLLKVDSISSLRALLALPSPEYQLLPPVLKNMARFLPLQGDLKSGLQTLLNASLTQSGSSFSNPKNQTALKSHSLSQRQSAYGRVGTHVTDEAMLTQNLRIRQSLENLLVASANQNSGQSVSAGQNPKQSSQQAVPPLVRDLLTVINKAILTPAQSQDPRQLKAGLNLSGMAMEAAFLTGKLASGSIPAKPINAGSGLSTSKDVTNHLARNISSWLAANQSGSNFGNPANILRSPLLQAAPADLKGLLLTALAATLSHLQHHSANHALPTNWESLVSWLMPRTANFHPPGHPLQFPGQIAHAARQAVTSEGLDVGEVLRALAQTIARIQVNQFNALQQSPGQTGEQSSGQVWLAELPILGQQLDTLQMRLEKKPSQQSNNPRKHQWTLNLAFDFEGLGPLQSHVVYTDGTVSATFWADRQLTLKLLNDELPKLRKGLIDWGVLVGDIKVRKGQPPPPKNPIAHQLLDERA